MAKEIKETKKGEKKGNPHILPIGGLILASVCGPYIYYATMVNIKGSANVPEGTKFSSFNDYWKVLVSAVATQVVRNICYFFGYNFYHPKAKGDSADDQHKYTMKACEFTFRTIYFTVAAIWGYNVL